MVELLSANRRKKIRRCRHEAAGTGQERGSEKKKEYEDSEEVQAKEQE